jgi:hypothetical protein
VLLLFLEHVPARAGADVVVVVVVVLAIWAEGCTGAVGKDERKVSNRLWQRSMQQGVVLGIFWRGGRGQRRELDGRIGGGGGRRRGDPATGKDDSGDRKRGHTLWCSPRAAAAETVSSYSTRGGVSIDLISAPC